MAHVTITLVDLPDGGTRLEIHSDPEPKQGTPPEELTNAQRGAMAVKKMLLDMSDSYTKVLEN